MRKGGEDLDVEKIDWAVWIINRFDTVNVVSLYG